MTFGTPCTIGVPKVVTPWRSRNTRVIPCMRIIQVQKTFQMSLISLHTLLSWSSLPENLEYLRWQHFSTHTLTSQSLKNQMSLKIDQGMKESHCDLYYSDWKYCGCSFSQFHYIFSPHTAFSYFIFSQHTAFSHFIFSQHTAFSHFIFSQHTKEKAKDMRRVSVVSDVWGWGGSGKATWRRPCKVSKYIWTLWV